jgi:hypothetical protein
MNLYKLDRYRISVLESQKHRGSTHGLQIAPIQGNLQEVGRVEQGKPLSIILSFIGWNRIIDDLIVSFVDLSKSVIPCNDLKVPSFSNIRKYAF